MMASQIGTSKDSSVSFDDVNSAYEMVMSRLGKSLYGYSWGKSLAFLDEITNGLVKKRVYRIGATSNTGKTQLVYNLLPSLLEQKNEDGTYVKVAFFTLENTREDTLVSIMCNYAKLDAKALNK
jgi:replicative DNA helicase